MDGTSIVVGALVGALGGAALGFLVARLRSSNRETELSTRLAERDREAQQARETAAAHQAEAARESQARAALEQALKDEQAKSAEHARLLDDAQTKLSNTFKALAADALRDQSKDFLLLAREQLGAQQSASAQDLDARKREIDLLVQPLNEHLKTMVEHAQALDRERREQHGALDEQLRSLARETKTLSTALRQPHVRGKWGELTLRRVVELAGMSEHCDFEEQVTVEGEDGKLRPDMVVHLPAGRDVVVDAKTSLLLSYTEAVEADTDDARAEALRKHAQLVRNHVQKLAAKQYWDQFALAPEFVVLFLYNEAAFGAALNVDPELFDYALGNRVLVATPTTLIALLKAVAYGWRQEKLADEAARISDLGRQLFDRIATFTDHLSNVGARLRAAVDEYNKAVGSFESRVLPGARKFKELGVVSEDGKDIDALEPIEKRPRTLEATGTLALFEDNGK